MNDDMISINAPQISHQCYCHFANYSYKCLRMFDYMRNNFRYYPGASQVITIHIINMRWQLVMSVSNLPVTERTWINQGMFFKIFEK